MTTIQEISRLTIFTEENINEISSQLGEKEIEWANGNPEKVFELLISAIKNNTPQPLFSEPIPVTLPPVEAQSIKGCFQNQKGLTWWRDGDLDNPNWISQNYDSHLGGEGQVLPLTQEVQFKEMIKVALGYNTDANISDQELQKQLISRGRCLRPKHPELLVQDLVFNKNQNLAFLQDGRATLIPVDNGNGTVSFLSVRWNAGRGEWSADVRHFGFDGRWCAGRRLLLCNSGRS